MKALTWIHLWLALSVLVVLHVGVWLSVRDVRASWLNVPPVPGVTGVAASTLGDRQFAYRTTGLMLQNLGNTGGRAEPLKNYDYERLKEWLLLSWKLDSRSNFIPYLAAYYFGGVEESEKLPPLIDYLAEAGRGPEGEKWRWTAQAVYLARYKLNDLNLAYELAVELAANKDENLPAWAKQMPAFVLMAKGEKEAAYEIMINILKSSADKMPVQEINFMRHYICDNILEPAEAKKLDLCDDVKW